MNHLADPREPTSPALILAKPLSNPSYALDLVAPPLASPFVDNQPGCMFDDCARSLVREAYTDFSTLKSPSVLVLVDPGTYSAAAGRCHGQPRAKDEPALFGQDTDPCVKSAKYHESAVLKEFVSILHELEELANEVRRLVVPVSLQHDYTHQDADVPSETISPLCPNFLVLDDQAEPGDHQRTHTCARSEESGYFSGSPSPCLSAVGWKRDAVPQQQRLVEPRDRYRAVKESQRPLSAQDIPFLASPMDADLVAPSTSTNASVPDHRHKLRPIFKNILLRHKRSMPHLSSSKASRQSVETSSKAQSNPRRLRSLMFREVVNRPETKPTSFLDI